MGFGCLSATVEGNKRFPTMNLDPDGDGLGGGGGVEPARGRRSSKEEDDFHLFFGYTYKIFHEERELCVYGGGSGYD